MQIILGAYGFCDGVKRAVNMAKHATAKGNRAFCLHPLIHNAGVIKKLEENNIFSLKEKEGMDANDVVLISAHGCSPQIKKDLKTKYNCVIDATCPFVQVIHNKVTEYSQKGYEIIIIGDANHAEVLGIAGCIDRCQIIKNCEEINFDLAERFFVVAQTTFPIILYTEIVKNINEKAKKLLKTVEFFESICYTTIKRQNEANLLAKNSDIILVIGDKSSSNCKKLLEISSLWCKNVFLIQNISDLKSVNIHKNNAKLGIISSASTPEELTMEVFNRMSELNTNDIIVNDEVKVTEPIAEAATVESTKEAKESSNQDFSSMEEAMKQHSYNAKSYREGQRLKARVIKVDTSGISVALEGATGKNDCGFIAKEEAELDGSYDPSNYNIDDLLNVIIIPKDNNSKDKTINLSKKAYDAMKADDEHVKKILAGEEFTLACTQEIKGGLLGKIGTYTIFVPASQIRIGFVKTLSDYVNKPLRLKALPPKEEIAEDGTKKPRNAKRIVASQRIILEAEKSAREEEFWAKVYEGAIVNGKVKRFTAFGAFVSLKFMDALVHNSDLSWSKKRINDPGEVLEINKNYDFLVMSVDRENGKISLGYKQLQKHPSEIAQEKYPVGSVVKGKVARIVKFGAFIELEPGIDGLVHISQINRGWIQNANEALKEGDEVEVKVMAYDNDRITLSIKELLPELPVEEHVAPEVEEKTTSRTANFNKRLEGQEKTEKKEKRQRKERTDDSGEPREYVSYSSGVTLGDLFKLNFNESEDKE
ncbi:4-hydroxy-3-methylbut-2-enyl diphosphate reductase [bacterium]|nr:4-hydroxy-3-methylbut-2-enyl diphosphate reductase [bacterium]